jgi:hypothetical protein
MGSLMTIKVSREEAVVPVFENLSQNLRGFVDANNENSATIAGVPAETQGLVLQNKNQKL